MTKEVELDKCLHGQTQNANESFNNMIWERAPKANYCGLKTLKLSVYDAVASFNYGGMATIDLCEQQNFTRKYVSVQKHGELEEAAQANSWCQEEKKVINVR